MEIVVGAVESFNWQDVTTQIFNEARFCDFDKILGHLSKPNIENFLVKI